MWPIVTDVWWSLCVSVSVSVFVSWTQSSHNRWGGSLAEWLACWTQVLGKLFAPIVPLFTKQRDWQQPS